MNLQIENTLSAVPSKTLSLKPQKEADAPQEARRDPPALSLDERGMIKDCNKSFEKLVGFRRAKLVWHHVSTVFPELKEVELFQKGQINPMLSYLSRCGQQYRIQHSLGGTISERLNFVSIDNGGKRVLRLIVLS